MKKTKVRRLRAQINLSIDPGVHELAMKTAYAEGMTLSRLTEKLYRDWLKSLKQSEVPALTPEQIRAAAESVTNAILKDSPNRPRL